MAGIRSLYANEICADYANTLKGFHSGIPVEVEDIRKLDPRSVLKRLGLKKGELDILAGGPPCQGFSVNAPIRTKSDQRNHLFLDFLRFVEAFKPKVVVIENVPGMISYEKGETVRSIIQALAGLGFSTAVRILFAPHYGVPQIRWRTIFIGTRLDVDPLNFFPEPTHFAVGRANFATRLAGQSLILDLVEIDRNRLAPATTVWDAISDLPEIESRGGKNDPAYASPPVNQYQLLLREDSKKVQNHFCAGLGAANLVRLKHIPQGGSWRDIPHDLLPLGMKRARKSDHTKRYGRLDPNGFSSTILTKCDPHWGTYIHPTQDRIISVREAARLQSFPDTLLFKGNLTSQYEQVGNAVPPLFAKAIGEQIKKAFSLSETARGKSAGSAWHERQMALPLLQTLSEHV